MSDKSKGVALSLRVMINKERNKVLFAEADSHFADILLSFLSLPLGRILKVLEKESGDEAATIGSLSSLYRSLANLDRAHFVTDGAKQALLSPSSSFEDEYKRLKIDITDSPPAEYFYCYYSSHYSRFRTVSIYYDNLSICEVCRRTYKGVAKQRSIIAPASSDGVLTIRKASFTISDDLQILPNEIGLLRIITLLGIADAHKAEEIKVDLGLDKGPGTYNVTDDLTVTPFCVFSALSSLTSMNIPISDVQEMELQIGLKEAVNILSASLVSTSTLTDALLTHSSTKRPKKELQD